MSREPMISVVVPTFKRPPLLARCLRALIAQDCTFAYEIIVVDDEPSTQTRKLVGELAKAAAIPILYRCTKGQCGPAQARNIGWHEARGQMIAFTDDDTIPDAAWLEEGHKAMSEEGVAAVWGRIIVPVDDGTTPTDFVRDTTKLATAGFVTANCFCWRHHLAAIGGFDERFRAAWREDSDLFFSLKKAGFGKIVHYKPAVVVHPAREASFGVSISQQRKAVYNALLYKKHPKLYRRYVQRWPPGHYYVHVLAGVVLIASLFGEFATPWAGMAAFLWLATLLGFIGYRLRDTSRRLPHVIEMVVTSLVIPWLSVFWRLRGAIRYRVLFI